jgi:hypothetical protein
MECHEERGVAVARNDLRRNRLPARGELIRDIVANRTPTWTGLDAPL